MIPTKDMLVDALRTLVEAETPSGDSESLETGFLILRRLLEDLTGRKARIGHVDGVPYLHLPATAAPSVLIIGHLDTVWPVGTLTEIPFSVVDEIARGPGVFDMKSGLVIAMGALAGCAVPDHVGLLVTGDEEIGSATGRSLVELHSSAPLAVLIPEPSAPGGGIKLARKGVGIYGFAIRGREAHAGLEPERGFNATVEMGALIADLVELGDAAVGTTVTPTKANSGVTVNTVPADAMLHADVRAWTLPELKRVDAAIRARGPRVPGVEVTVHGGINRPPMEAGVSTALAELAQQAARDLGMDPIETTMVGGGSDGNFSAALGTPTLDGVGALGGGAHARHEWVDVSSLTDRARWLASLCERVVRGELGG